MMKKEKKILWLSRHSPQPAQVAELKNIFGGETCIVQVSETVKDADDVLALMREYGTEDIVTVLPPALLADLTRRGVKPIRAVMNREVSETGEVTFTHDHFERVERVEIVTTPLKIEEERP